MCVLCRQRRGEYAANASHIFMLFDIVLFLMCLLFLIARHSDVCLLFVLYSSCDTMLLNTY